VPDARPRARLDQLRNLDRAVLANAAEVVAHQVGDHHVLRAVLRGRDQRVASAGLAGCGPLDRLGDHAPPVAAQEQLRRQAAHGAPRAGHHPGVTRLQGAGRAREQVERVARPAALEAQADIGLEDLPGGDPLAALRHRGEMTGGPGRRRLELAHPYRARAHRAGQARLQHLDPAAQLRSAGVRPQGLEPPLPVAVEAEQVVVEGEREARQRRRPRRRGRDPLEARAEAIAEPPEPTAAHRARLGLADVRLDVEELEGVVAVRRGRQRLGSDQRAAAGPGACEREGPAVAAHQQAGVRGRDVPREGDPDEAGAARHRHRSEPRWSG
jgi:hypothetical protein